LQLLAVAPRRDGSILSPYHAPHAPARRRIRL